MYCRNCGEQMNENQEICLKCGVKKGTGKKFCQNCGKPTSENAAVCLSCGVAIGKGGASGGSSSLDGKDKTMMALICFFVGGFGIHNFMLGETKKGIFKIVMTCLCGIGCILSLIDLVRILTDKYEVDPTKLF